MSEWQTLPIGRLGRVVTGKTPPTGEAQYFGGNELFVSPKDLSRDSYYVSETETRVTERAFEKFKNQVVPKNAVLFTSLSFAFGKMGIAARNLLTNQQINSVVVNVEHDFKFVYYLLRAYESIIFSYNSGIDTPIVPKSVFERINVRTPSKVEQRKIAAVLSAYDDLIENNRRRIALLEKMAEQLYREWFVRFRFPGYQHAKFEKGRPATWRMRKLPELAYITYGFPFEGHRFNTAGIGKPIVRIRNVPIAATVDHTDQIADEKYLIRSGDLLIGMDGEFHMNHWHGEDAYLVQRVCRIKPKSEKLRAYLYWALRAPIKHFEATIVGATVAHLGAKHLNSIELAVPEGRPREVLKPLNDLLEQKLTLARANDQLSKARDLLLPRLISGKLRVDDLDIQFPPSMQAENA